MPSLVLLSGDAFILFIEETERNSQKWQQYTYKEQSPVEVSFFVTIQLVYHYPSFAVDYDQYSQIVEHLFLGFEVCSTK